MTEYDIAQLAEKPEGEYEVQPFSERVGSVVAYTVALTYILRELMKETRTGVIGSYKLGFVDENIFTGLKTSGENLVQITKPKVTDIFEGESISHTRRFINAVKKALGIDVSVLVRNDDNAELIRAYIDKNTSLITSMKNDLIKRIEQEVYKAKIDNKSATELSKILQKQFGLMKNRADLIASDQLSKLNADMNELRLKQAGNKDYRWDYQHGIPRQNSREHHKARHGRIFKFGKPAEDMPSKALRCTCRATMVVRVVK